jgi:multiple sugar transport system substrate-binding protein
MKTKKTVNVIAIAALAAMTAACGAGKTDGDEAGKPIGQAAKEEAKPVELTWYHVPTDGPVGDAFMQQYGEPIQRKYPNYSFQVLVNKEQNTLANMVMSKTSLDVMLASFASLQSVKENGLLSDMSDLVKKHNFDLSRIEAEPLEMMRKMEEGKLTSLPLYDLRLVLYYNKDLFDKFGVPYPKNGMTWGELLDVAKRMTRTEGGVSYRGFVTPPVTVVNANQRSLNYIDTKTNRSAIMTEEWKSHMETFIPFYTVPGYDATPETMNSANMMNMFLKEQTAAMFVAYNSFAATIKQNVQNWDAVSLPEMSDLRGVASQPYPVVLSIPSTSKHRDEAFLAIAQLLSDEVQKERAAKLGFLAPLKNPAVKSAFASEVVDWKGKNISAVTAQKSPSPIAYSKYNAQGAAAIASAMLAVITGQKDVNTALREEDEKLNKTIETAEAANK